MSSSTGYDYSYVDLELAARREARKRFAELAAEAGLLRDQARRLAGKRAVPAVLHLTWPDDDADSARVRLAAEHAEAAVSEGRREVDRLFTRSLLAGLARGATEPAGRRPQTRSVVPATCAPDLQRVREAALARAERMLREDGPRCAPEDVAELSGLLAELGEAAGTDLVHRTIGEFERRVAESIRRRGDQERDVLARARLRTLAGYAPDDRREALLAAVESEPDLGKVTELVTAAVRDADAAAAQTAVATVAADALAAIGCDVGEDFDTVLAGDGESVVPLGTGWTAARYALLIRMDPHSRRLYTAVVRNAGTAPDEAADVEAQRRFCDSGLMDRLREQMAEGGVRLHQALRLEPGRRPMPTVDAERWPSAGTAKEAAAAPRQRRARPANTTTASPRRRERHRER